MSHRISRELAKQLYEKDLQLKQHPELQQPSSRRQKKYELARKKQDGFLWRLKDRIKATGGKLPEHLKEEDS